MAEPMSGSLDSLTGRNSFKHYSRPVQYAKRSKPQLFSDITDQFTPINQANINQSQPQAQPLINSPKPTPSPVSQPPIYRPVTDDVNIVPRSEIEPSFSEASEENYHEQFTQPVQPSAVNQADYQLESSTPETFPQPEQAPQPEPIPTVQPTQTVNSDDQQPYNNLPAEVPIYANNYNGEYEDSRSSKFSLKGLPGSKKLLLFGTSIVTVAVLAGLFGFLLRTNNSNVVQAQASNSQSNQASSIAVGGKSGLSTSTSSYASTIEPTQSQISSYTVGVAQPRYLIIPQLKVYSMITPVNLNSSNNLDAPNNIYNVGWWQSSSLPNQTGAVVLDGFRTNGLQDGVFGTLNKIAVGDVIEVELGNSNAVDYKVVKIAPFGAPNGVTMDQAVSPISSSANSLNIITCSGLSFTCPDSSGQDFVVFAEQD